jgi:TetR/AcrR family transcriptional regulator
LDRTGTDAATSQSREHIVDAASAIFADKGFAGARVDEIARRAGVNKAMLYYHVGDKQTLYTAVLTRNFERGEAALTAALTTGGSARARLQAVISALLVIVHTFPDHPRIMLREIAAGGANLAPGVLRRMLGLLETVAGLLAEGREAGEFRDTDPVLTHLAVVGAALFLASIGPLRERAADLGVALDFPATDTDIAGLFGDLILHGVSAVPRSGDEA